MKHRPSPSASDLWDYVVEQHITGSADDFAKAANLFLANGMDRIPILKKALRGNERATAIVLLARLSLSELQQLFDELIFLASFSHGRIQAIRDAILSLPGQWVLDHIEANMEPLLVNGTYAEYRQLLELYVLIDRSAAKKLALRAIAHPDRDVKEAGEDFLQELKDF
jgi:hypothetical protein